MGKRGPRPAPTHLKLLRGNRGHRPLNKFEPQPRRPAATPDAPAFLNGYAAEEWQRVAEELFNLRLLTVVDIQPLAAYCQAYAIWRTAVERLATVAAGEPETKGLSSGTSQNSLLLTIRQTSNDMVRFAAEFGLTPSSRSRFSSKHETQSPASKFGPLLVG